jgi:hypothetical protein
MEIFTGFIVEAMFDFVLQAFVSEQLNA